MSTAPTTTKLIPDIKLFDDRKLWRWIQLARESVTEAWTPATESIKAMLVELEAEGHERKLSYMQ